jgi:hypothetical protein
VPEQDGFLSTRGFETIPRHANILAKLGRRERRFLSGLKAGVSAPRS